MQFKKHNSKTPPERKPKWLRKGIAVLAAIATLATGGIVASTAYADDDDTSDTSDTGSGGNSGGGPVPQGAGKRPFQIMWNYADKGKGFGPASDWHSTEAAITGGANGFKGLGWTIKSDGDAWIQDATNKANTNCEARVQKVYPGAPNNTCRVVGVGIIGNDSHEFGYSAGASHSIWMKYWYSAIAGENHSNKYGNGSGKAYSTDTEFKKDPGWSVDKIADTYAPDWVNNASTGTIVVIALSRYYNPFGVPKFTPTIRTDAPHVIQEGQSISDNVTVGVKDGEQWATGASVKAKGYYFTGSKAFSESSVPICDTRGGPGAEGVGTEGTRREPAIGRNQSKTPEPE